MGECKRCGAEIAFLITYCASCRTAIEMQERQTKALEVAAEAQKTMLRLKSENDSITKSTLDTIFNLSTKKPRILQLFKKYENWDEGTPVRVSEIKELRLFVTSLDRVNSAYVLDLRYKEILASIRSDVVKANTSVVKRLMRRKAQEEKRAEKEKEDKKFRCPNSVCSFKYIIRKMNRYRKRTCPLCGTSCILYPDGSSKATKTVGTQADSHPPLEVVGQKNIIKAVRPDISKVARKPEGLVTRLYRGLFG